MIRNFYNSTVGRLSKTFEFSKIGELENIKKLKMVKFEQSFQMIPGGLDDMLASISQNVSNKSFISLARCLELIQKQYSKLMLRRRDLGEQIDAVLAGSAEDIKNIKLPEENLNPFRSVNSFTERDECKQKFKIYLEKARLILACKQETNQLVRTILADVELVDAQIREFEYLRENIRLSLEGYIAPELLRRKEFEGICKDIANFQWYLVSKENEAREKFLDVADLQKLPYAVKKILLEFVDEEAGCFTQQKDKTSAPELKELVKSVESFYEKWSHQANPEFKNRLETLLKQNESLQQELALETVKHSVAAPETVRLRSEVDKLREQLDAALAEQQMLQSRLQEEQTLHAQELAALRSEKDGLVHKLQDSLSGVVETLRANTREQELNDRIRLLEQERKAQTELAAVHEQRVQQLTHDLDQQELQTHELREKVAEQNQKMEVLATELSEAQSVLQRAKQAFSNQISEFEQQESSHVQLRQEITQCHIKIKEYERKIEGMTDSIIKLNKRAEEAEQSRNQVNGNQTEQISELTSRLTAAIQEAVELKTQLTITTEERDSILKESQCMSQDYKAAMELKESDIKVLQEKYEREVRQLRDQMTEMSEKIVLLEEERHSQHGSLEEQLEATKSDLMKALDGLAAKELECQALKFGQKRPASGLDKKAVEERIHTIETQFRAFQKTAEARIEAAENRVKVAAEAAEGRQLDMLSQFIGRRAA